MTAGALLATVLCGCGGDGAGDPPAVAGQGGGAAGHAGSSAGGATLGGSGGLGGGAGGSSAGANTGGSGGMATTGCMRVPSSDAACVDNFPEAPQAHSCADLSSGFDLDDEHDNTCWNTNVVPGGAIGYCCPAK
jgi:hypothetical protein